MKLSHFLVATTALLSSHVLAVGEGYTNFIRQNQLTTGVIWDMPVSPSGAGASNKPLEEKGALFQLWTIQQSPVTSYLLDQKLVGVFPTAVITIATEDPFTSYARTRADRPFTVTFDVSGLGNAADTTLPDAAKKVLLQQYTTPYPTGVTSLTAVAATLTSNLFAQGYVLGTATPGVNRTVFNFARTSIKATDLTQATGEEYFLAHALTNGTTPQTQIASNYVQILPIASGSLTGIANNANIRSSAPPVTVTLKNLYPRSDTWVQIYKTSQGSATATTVLGSMLVLDQTKPDSRTLTLTGYDSIFSTGGDGAYVMELLTKTPFGTDRLYSVPFTVTRTLAVNSLLGNAAQSK